MTVDEIKKLCTGETIKIGKNQIYMDDVYFIVEKFEYTDETYGDQFSVVDGFRLLEDAIDSAKNN